MLYQGEMGGELLLARVKDRNELTIRFVASKFHGLVCLL
jgi:hypothetical protein